MAKAKKPTEVAAWDLTNVHTELDVLWMLHHIVVLGDEKLLFKTIKRMRSKLCHRISPNVFNRMLMADKPFELVEHILENYLAKPPAGEIDLTKHGVCEVFAVHDDGYVHEYIHFDLGTDRVDILTAQRYEAQVAEQCAIEATQACELRQATVNVTFFKDHGFSGTTLQFEIGSK